MMKFLLKTFLELNIFSPSNFGSSINRVTAKQYGRWATRLYILLFIIGITIIIFYTTIRPHTVIETFDQPLFNSYQQLQKDYGNKLKCSCSQIASTYNKFVEITPEFHPICLSKFVSKEWHTSIINRLALNFSVYSKNDYRRFLPAHLQYLQELCRLSNQSVNNTIKEFLTSLLVTVELRSEEDFHRRIETLIVQSKSNVPILLSRFLYMIQSFNHGNAFMTTYETNFQYTSSVSFLSWKYAYTDAIIYDNNCSCGLSSNCTTQAIFIENSTEIPIEGLKMGCLPSESFHLSTLECFYNQSCLDLISNYTNYDNISTHRLNISTRFPPNTTINQLISHSFTQQWLNKSNYSLYYHQCSPSSCSYTYNERFNIFYIITLFLSLQGGLMFVLAWICPKLIRIIFEINDYYQRKRQRTSVHPDNSLITSSNNINIQTEANRTSDFSIYYVRNIAIITNRNIITTTTTTTTITTTVISTISSITTKLLCRTKFQRISTNTSCSGFKEITFHNLTGDFNNDNQVDFVYVCKSNDKGAIFVSFNNGDGTFYNFMIESLLNFQSIKLLYVADFNNDNRSDIFLIYEVGWQDDLTVLLNNGNKTFKTLTMEAIGNIGGIRAPRIADFNNDNKYDVFFTLYDGSKENLKVLLGHGNGTFERIIKNSPMRAIYRTKDTILCDLNNDKILDIVRTFESVANIGGIAIEFNNVGVAFGRGNGTFSSENLLSNEYTMYSSRLIVAHINNDHYLDIVVYNKHSKHIYVYFGSANGTFYLQSPFFTTIGDNNHFLVIDDFDNNNQSDIIFIYNWKDVECITYHYHNNSFIKNKKTLIKSNGTLNSIVVHDINNDMNLDIILHMNNPNQIYILFGYGNGSFYTQMIYSREILESSSSLIIYDLNNDNYQDIISVDHKINLIDVFLNTRNCSTN
ncbi:unnamed protein product [Adineta ricciae]|uniref:Uncharacterized protein n=1 Tax=Adineta ricciae TaxID=249248 RepID=A0A815UJZ2_ADIRI|nr:unnamed protein product [Adineta ricciae]CAF1640567.1 unnamed protein product [Adineta ricciae]